MPGSSSTTRIRVIALPPPAGRSIVNTLPEPGSLASVTLRHAPPRCAAPSPDPRRNPSHWPLRAALPRTNLRKMALFSEAGIPGPLSRTRIATCDSSTPHSHPHRRTIRRVFQRVVHQIAQRHRQRFRVGVDRASASDSIEFDMPSRTGDLRLELGRDPRYQRGRIQLLRTGTAGPPPPSGRNSAAPSTSRCSRVVSRTSVS